MWEEEGKESGLLVPLSESVLKFNVDGASRAKPGRVGIRGVLRNYKGEVLLMFSKNVGV